MPDSPTFVLADTFGWVDAIPWVLVIVGWLVAIAQSSRHDDRVDMRASIDRITELLAELERKAICYHVSNAPAVVEALEIKALIARISSQINQLELLEYQEYLKVANLRRAITLNNFDSAKHKPQGTNSTLLQEIGFSINDVVDCLESRYYEKFTKKFWV